MANHSRAYTIFLIFDTSHTIQRHMFIFWDRASTFEQSKSEIKKLNHLDEIYKHSFSEQSNPQRKKLPLNYSFLPSKLNFVRALSRLDTELLLVFSDRREKVSRAREMRGSRHAFYDSMILHISWDVDELSTSTSRTAGIIELVKYRLNRPAICRDAASRTDGTQLEHTCA